MVAARVAFQQDEPVDEVGPGARGEERGVRPHRLADEAHRLAGEELLDDGDHVADERVPGEVAGAARAEAVPPLVDEEDAKAVGERVGGGEKLAGAAGQSVEQHHGRAVTAPVDDGDAGVPAPDLRGGGGHGVVPAAASPCGAPPAPLPESPPDSWA